MADQTNAKVFYYGLDPAADLFADNIESFGPDGLKFDLNCHGDRKTIRTPLIGRHSVLTALRGAAVGLVKKMDWAEIIDVLENSHSKLRMRLTHTIAGGTLIDDSYNASPDATIAALNLLGEMHGRRIAVLGEMRELGQYEKKGHEMVGEKAAGSCDELITVGPVTKYIAEAAVTEGMDPEKVHWFETVPEVIEFLQDGYVTADDVLLVKGSLAMGMSRIVSVLEEQK
jgi:UDP-N-acetylmuramoyl-tripeptide--D-alanyl-D-alanine ligase